MTPINGRGIVVPTPDTRTAKIATALSRAAVMGSLVLACVLSLRDGPSIVPKVPIALAAISAALWLKVTDGRLSALRRLAAVYLCLVPFNQVLHRYWEVRLPGHAISVSWGLTTLVIAMAGTGIAMAFGRGIRPAMPGRGATYGAVASPLMLLLHMAILVAMLATVYGYGYEHSFDAFGSVSMFCLLGLVINGLLQRPAMLRVVSAVLVSFYLAIALGYGRL